MLRYTVLRLLVFFVFTLAFVWVGVPGLWAVVFGALFSMVTSLFLLRRQRDQMAQDVVARIDRGRSRRAEKIAAQRTDEDEEDGEVEGNRAP
ncbi:MAG: DUF4229 domain-containing protein [Ornithinimicrobium sp.]